MGEFNAIDLFCGAGGLSLGFQQERGQRRKPFVKEKLVGASVWREKLKNKESPKGLSFP